MSKKEVEVAGVPVQTVKDKLTTAMVRLAAQGSVPAAKQVLEILNEAERNAKCEDIELKPVKKHKSKRGRPTKKTPALVDALVKAITNGMSFRHSCQLVGISYAGFCKWMERGRNGEQEYVDFFDRIKSAEALCIENALEVIQKSALIDKNWTAAAWILERKYPELYGKNRLQSDTVQSIELKITGLPRPKEKKTIDI